MEGAVMKSKSHVYFCLHPFLTSISKNPFKTLRILPIIFIVLFASAGLSDEINYIYDDAGQLIRAVKSTEVISYQYDANGNPVAVGGGVASEEGPIIESVTPAVLFIGATTDIVITGKSLYSAKGIASQNPGMGTQIRAITDTQIRASIIVPSDALPGSSVLTVETLYGSAPVKVSLSGSRVEFFPDALSLVPGGSVIVEVRILPAVSSPLTLWLTNSNPSAVSSPSSVSVSESGVGTFEVKALAQGSAEVGSSGSSASVYVVPAFLLAAGETAWAASKPVSVFIDSQSMQRSDIVALPVSVFIDSPTLQPAYITSLPVSVFIDSSVGNSTVVSTSVSVQISP